ncbi:unnamed protein product [Rotaria sordida]|uniref:PAS domain-containing protein n=1 Tax=Rotaria sordida TaxID=392033 RepID=A0A815FBL8_9BILA|nr:unnamed protein product [Rotaria sordida]CAF1589386.1 unnamed protein product [Rotaria sordida]
MQNSLQFYAEHNSHSIEDSFHSNSLDALIENDTFELSSYASVSTNQTSAISSPTSSNMARRRDKITTASVLTKSAEEGNSDDLARKREEHRLVEEHRRAIEQERFTEISMLITNRSDLKSTKLRHIDVLEIAVDETFKINFNSFLFVTTIESTSFRVIYVTDAINRILNITRDQWLEQDFLSFIHPVDFIRFRSQLMLLNQHIGMSIHLECRLKQGNNDMYSSVIIDGFLAFVGIFHLPFITKYKETNMCRYKDPQSLSRLPSISYDLFRQKSILDFIHTDEQALVHQVLLCSIIASTTKTITCNFIHPTLQTSIPMTLEIKSFFNRITHQPNFIELTFKSLFDFIDQAQEIDKLFESDLSVSTQQTIEEQLNNNPTTQTTPYYYSNGWTTINELL